MSVKQINKSIKIIDDSFMEVTKSFAENNLSKTCLKYCDYSDDKYYEWTLGSSAYIVIFELPQVFNAHIQDIFDLLLFYCIDYVNEIGITGDNFINVYRENLKKKIVFKNED